MKSGKVWVIVVYVVQVVPERFKNLKEWFRSLASERPIQLIIVSLTATGVVLQFIQLMLSIKG